MSYMVDCSKNCLQCPGIRHYILFYLQNKISKRRECFDYTRKWRTMNITVTILLLIHVKYSETSIHHTSMHLSPHIPIHFQWIITLDTLFLSVLFCCVNLSKSESNVIFLEYTAVLMCPYW
jgi:hypothetical protein